MEMPSKITEKTFISLQLVVMVIGLSVWVVRSSDKVEQNAETIKNLQAADRELAREQMDCERRLYRIESRLGLKHYDERE